MSTAAEKSIPNWKLTGDWFDVCKCNVPCPCTFAQAPSYGDCDGVSYGHTANVPMNWGKLLPISKYGVHKFNLF
jgi:hypothetical protein